MMLNELKSFLGQHNLIPPGQKVLLAVSGGIDSVVMTDALSKLREELGFGLAIAHCNFRLRGAESNHDMEFVVDFASQHGFVVHVKDFNTEDYAKENGISVQMAARDLRHQWFSELLNQNGYDVVALGHNLNDQMETIIYHLVQGTGISGLAGMRFAIGHVIRPLLFCSRTEIEEYADDQKLTWREDSTNKDSKYRRNLIRNEVMPILARINPSLFETFRNTHVRLQEGRVLLEAAISDMKVKASGNRDGHTTIRKEELINSPGPSVLLFEFIGELGFNYTQCRDILNSINDVGKTFLSKSHVLNIDRKEIIISEVTQDDSELHRRLDGGILIEGIGTFDIGLGKLHIAMVEGGIEDHPSTSDTVAFLDSKKVKFPLSIRRWKDGDWFIPLGMEGKKKVSDFMIDCKIPLNLKRSVFLLEDGKGDIVWVVGHRIDNRAKVVDSTAEILKLEYVQV